MNKSKVYEGIFSLVMGIVFLLIPISIFCLVFGIISIATGIYYIVKGYSEPDPSQVTQHYPPPPPQYQQQSYYGQQQYYQQQYPQQQQYQQQYYQQQGLPKAQYDRRAMGGGLQAACPYCRTQQSMPPPGSVVTCVSCLRQFQA